MAFKPQAILLLDTETATLTDFVYDVAYAITDRKGRVLETFNALVEENVTVPEKMAKAYYQKKTYTHYIPMLGNDEIELMPWSEIVANMRESIARHNVGILSAYNLGFDAKVMRATNKDLGDGPIFQQPVRQLDLWRFAAQTLLSQKSYESFAREHGLISAAGNLKSSAEASYRYIHRNPDFVEDHTALSDVLVENDIMARCFAQKKTVPFADTLSDRTAPWMLIPANAENMKTRRRA